MDTRFCVVVEPRGRRGKKSTLLTACLWCSGCRMFEASFMLESVMPVEAATDITSFVNNYIVCYSLVLDTWQREANHVQYIWMFNMDIVFRKINIYNKPKIILHAYAEFICLQICIFVSLRNNVFWSNNSHANVCRRVYALIFHWSHCTYFTPTLWRSKWTVRNCKSMAIIFSNRYHPAYIVCCSNSREPNKEKHKNGRFGCVVS